MPSNSSAEQLAARLLDAVFANPADDAARAVYADHLSGLGQPRGEFIALQLQQALRPSRAAQTRINQLLRTHSQAFARPLVSTQHQHTGFQRGFVDTIKVLRVDRLRELRTVRRLVVNDLSATAVTLLNTEALPELRSLFWVNSAHAKSLRHEGLTELGLVGHQFPKKHDLNALPALESLWVWNTDSEPEKLLSLRAFSRLERLALQWRAPGYGPSVSAWRSVLLNADSVPESVSFWEDDTHTFPGSRGWEFRLEGPRLAHLQVVWHGGYTRHALSPLTPETIRTVSSIAISGAKGAALRAARAFKAQAGRTVKLEA